MAKKEQDIRWQQRFSNYRKALARLTQAVEIMQQHETAGNELEALLQEGLIQRFEYTHELAWKVMKDYAEYQGYTDIRGSRDAIRKALEMGLIDDRRNGKPCGKYSPGMNASNRSSCTARGLKARTSLSRMSI